MCVCVCARVFIAVCRCSCLGRMFVAVMQMKCKLTPFCCALCVDITLWWIYYEMIHIFAVRSSIYKITNQPEYIYMNFSRAIFLSCFAIYTELLENTNCKTRSYLLSDYNEYKMRNCHCPPMMLTKSKRPTLWLLRFPEQCWSNLSNVSVYSVCSSHGV